MRLKQLLSSVGMLLILSTVAFAANTQSAAAPAIAASQSVAANKSAAPAPTSAKPAATPTSSSVATPAPVVVRNISVVQGDGTINVEIATNGPITPKATRLSAPARIVLDFPNSIPAGRNQVVPVESGDVKEVRLAQFQADPPVVRVVVDMASARPYDLSRSGNKITLKFRSSEAHAPSVKAAVPAALKTEAPKSEAKTEPKTESAPATVLPVLQPAAAPVKTPAPKHSVPMQPVDAQDVVAKAQAPKQEQALAAIATPEKAATPDNKPSDFLVVSPTYATKTEEAVQQTSARNPREDADAAARVIATAAKAFPGQPVSNLASPVTAAMPAPAGQQNGQGPKRYTGEPISVNLKDVDLKDFFRLVHEISGLNIVLDPNVHGTLTLVLDDVPWDQALDIVLENNGLDRVLEGNVLRIATIDTLRKEADAQRQKNEAEALSVPKVSVTHFLSYARAADVVPVVKKFLSQRGDVIADTRTNSVIVSDIPAVIPEIQRLMTQLDRKTEEVEIEARVIAATRNFARDIGVQLGFGWGNGNGTAVGGAGAVGTSPLTPGYTAPPPYFTIPGVPLPTGTTATATPAAIPLFSNLGVVGPTSGISLLNAVGNYRLDAVLTMAESRGLLKILSRPRVVTQNNVQAVVRQGLRVPVVTQAQLGGPPTTTYIEAFLRLTVTPQITIEHTIFMNIDVENTTPDFSREVQGNPTLITQQATTSVLVNDGGTVVIGGVIQTQNSINVQQVPLLGDLPVLGNLFKHRTVSTSTQELLFFVTPKIIQT
jgi:type IV pilus assembly protein PilQ